MAISQGNIDAAVRLIRQALGPGADGQTLHQALELLTTEEEVPAPVEQQGTQLAPNTDQPTTGVKDPDPAAPAFHGTTGGNRNAIEAAQAADGAAPEGAAGGGAPAPEQEPNGGDSGGETDEIVDEDDEDGDDEVATLGRKEDRTALLEKNVPDVVDGIVGASPTQLKKLRSEEENGENRVGVLNAIDARLEQLGAGGE